MVAGSHRKLTSTLLAVLTAALLWVAAAIPAAALTVTFVRHAQSEANAAGIIDTLVPGPNITTDVGVPQAAAVAAALAASGMDYDAIYTSNMVRTSQTAAPFAAETGLDPIALAGFREIGAGIFEGSSENSGLGRIGYALSPALWILGARALPILGGSDGNAFDARVDGALKVVEDSGAQMPVVFSHGATIMFWTMMNVDNPDLGLMLSHQLDNTDVVVVEGSAEEGWTLKSWAGKPVGPATLGTKLLVNVRDLVVAPQTAIYNVVQAFRTGDIRQISDALRDGIGDVLKAPITFVTAVVRDVVNAVTNPDPPAAATSSAPESVGAQQESEPAVEPVQEKARTADKLHRSDRIRVLTPSEDESPAAQDEDSVGLTDTETDTDTDTDDASVSDDSHATTGADSDPTGGTESDARKAAA
ncbi:histidine phosphatase family protein [Mycobacterium sp. SMC-4]|uniref:histidine phosphatase family protein n=1 Tax=Mycobacterium sp. SMC-4 TaxID=2857059 RepID=UPI003D074B3A